MPDERPDALIIDEGADNVATGLKPLRAGHVARVRSGSSMVNFRLRQDVSPGHKFAIKDIQKGQFILKYGEVIGAATTEIKAGAHVHVHNTTSLHGRIETHTQGQKAGRPIDDNRGRRENDIAKPSRKV